VIDTPGDQYEVGQQILLNQRARRRARGPAHQVTSHLKFPALDSDVALQPGLFRPVPCHSTKKNLESAPWITHDTI
jgi:hypothetical protein